MTAVDWEEVKRLAADFQRAQLTSTSQTLSERNCVEIINKLIELNLLDVIFTADGKEYITPQYLVKEIKDELYVSGGRINLVELSKSLNVDLSHVSARAGEVERSVPGCQIVMGQLVDQTYITSLCEQVNEKLNTSGQITTSELTRHYDLPSDFLQNLVEKNLGKLIFAKQDKSDSRLFFTEAFVEHNRRVVKGALASLTRPIHLSTILNICQPLTPRDFYAAFESLTEDKQVSGALTAKQGVNSLFIPYVYTKQQNEWVDNFFAQNNYLEYDALKRLGLSEPLSFIRRHFSGRGLVELVSCAIGPRLMDQAQSAVDEAILSGSYLDLTLMLPSILSSEDITKVLSMAIKKNKGKANVRLLCETVLITDKFLDQLSRPFSEGDIIQQKAAEAVASGAYIKAKVEQKIAKVGGALADHEDSKTERRDERRRKAAGGKGGGGTQGRETKTKSLKKKQDHRKGRTEFEDSDDEIEAKHKLVGELELFTLEEVEAMIEPQLEGERPELVNAVALELLPRLQAAAATAADIHYQRSTATTRRKAQADALSKLELLLQEVRQFEKGARLLGEKAGSYLVRTLGADLTNALICYLGEEVTGNESRAKAVNSLPPETRPAVSTLHKATLTASLDEFMAALEPALASADIIQRKPDKKKEKGLLTSRRDALMDDLRSCEEPARALHLAVVIIFQVAHATMLHISGKFVPSVLSQLKPNLTQKDFQTFVNYQDLVLKLLTCGEDSEAGDHLKSQLNEDLSHIKEIAFNYKKPVPEKPA